jgi:hypothetical protein
LSSSGGKRAWSGPAGLATPMVLSEFGLNVTADVQWRVFSAVSRCAREMLTEFAAARTPSPHSVPRSRRAASLRPAPFDCCRSHKVQNFRSYRSPRRRAPQAALVAYSFGGLRETRSALAYGTMPSSSPPSIGLGIGRRGDAPPSARVAVRLYRLR